LHPLAIIVTALVSTVATVVSAILHVKKIGGIDDEIRYLDSESSRIEFLPPDTRYNARYGKYHIDTSKMRNPGEMRSATLDKLIEVKEGRTRNWVCFLIFVGGVATVLAVLFTLL
jgi:hypothetical protein